MPDGLREHLDDFLSRELRAGGDETAIVSDPAELSLAAPAAFLDEKGRRYAPVWLAATVDGITRYAGVAVVVDAGPHGHRIDAGLASALGAHLMEVGDTAGIAADDE